MDDNDLIERIRNIARSFQLREPVAISRLWNTTQVEAESTLWRTFFDHNTGLIHFTGYVTEDGFRILRVMREFAEHKEKEGT